MNNEQELRAQLQEAKDKRGHRDISMGDGEYMDEIL